MASRPKGYGFSSELKRKVNAKYDSGKEAEAREWINKVIGRNVLNPEPDLEDFYKSLKSGEVLCDLANALGGKIKINSSKMAFKMMENIANFLKFMEECGCSSSDLFQTVDLYEKQNMPSVIDGIHALGRKAHSLGKTPYALGPKEATANKREFTDEQLKEGQNVIGLQMGSNKGASQAGDHFGRPRQVAGSNVYK